MRQVKERNARASSDSAGTVVGDVTSAASASGAGSSAAGINAASDSP